MKRLWLITLLAGVLVACQKTEELTPVSNDPNSSTKPLDKFDTAGQKLVAQGAFMSNVHPTSGNIKLYQKDGKQPLVFENFKTDPGPDLRIYLSEDKVASRFVEVSRQVNVGDYFVELPANADTKNQKFVLIWCKAFSVLFGNAELK